MISDYRDGDEIGAADEERLFSEATADQANGSIEEGPGSEDEGAPERIVSQREYDGLQERYLRLAAEYENFRKRTERERAEQSDRAQGQLVEKLLDVLDDLDRLTRFTDEGTTVESVLEGVRLIDRKFARALEMAGLEVVPVEGERFDPAHHEALMLTATNDPADDEMIGNVFQSGYKFRGLLLRPARVQVKRLES